MAEAAAVPRDWWKLALVTVPAILLAGSASGWLSGSGYGNPWFDGLAKPAFMPPGWVFGAAWSTLYAMMGLALARVLSSGPSERQRPALTLFFVQLALNFAWSPIFFAAHDIGLALIVIFVMLAIAAAATGQFLRIDRVAGALMLPYLAWLCFAAALTTGIDRLNPAAGSPLIG
jgi:tryptophan-rich sensory protein